MAIDRATCGAFNPEVLPSFLADEYAAACTDAGFPLGPSAVQQCVNDGNAITAQIDAHTQDIAANWHPQDTFSGEQLRAIVAAVFSYLDQAQTALTLAGGEGGLTDDLISQLKNETDEVARFRGLGGNYLSSADQADSLGVGVSAPGIKNWVTYSMNEASAAMVAAHVVGCVRPWWAGAWATFANAIGAAAGIIKNILGIAANVAGAAIKAVEGTFGLLGWITKWWPVTIGLVALTGYAVHRKRKYGRIFPERRLKGG